MSDNTCPECGFCELCRDHHRSDEVCANYLSEFERGYEECADGDADSLAESEREIPDRAVDGYEPVEMVGWATETLETFASDCSEFVEANASDLLVCGLSAYRAGCDFWLTRNRHGAGFWDEDYGKPSEVTEALKRLTDASHAAGEAELYIGSDGFIYQA